MAAAFASLQVRGNPMRRGCCGEHPAAASTGRSTRAALTRGGGVATTRVAILPAGSQGCFSGTSPPASALRGCLSFSSPSARALSASQFNWESAARKHVETSAIRKYVAATRAEINAMRACARVRFFFFLSPPSSPPLSLSPRAALQL